MLTVFLIAWIAMLAFPILHLFRLNKFSKFVRAEIDRVSGIRVRGNRDEMWPDVTACYDNLKWYDIFNYNFKSLMVYDSPSRFS